MLYSVYQRINVVPQLTTTRIIKLDRSNVKVKGELKDFFIRSSFDTRVIDIFVVDIPESYGFFLVGIGQLNFKAISPLIGPTYGSLTKLNLIRST
jgi:hypothetical protein